MATNIEKLKAAYEAWGNTKGDSISRWLELVGDDFEMRSVAPKPPGLAFAGVHKGPASLEVYLKSLLDAWRMEYYTVDTIIGDGDAVAIFGTCSWTFKSTGRTATTPIANLWRFRNGKAYQCIEIFDSARAAEAAMPG